MITTLLARDSGSRTCGWLRHPDRSHSGGGCGIDAELGVFEDQAAGRFYAEAFGGKKKAVGRGLAMRVVFGANESVEFVEQAERCERTDDRSAAAAGDNGQSGCGHAGRERARDRGDGFELRSCAW